LPNNKIRDINFNYLKNRIMKRYINIIALLALVILLVSSCKKYDYTYTYEGDNYVQILQRSGTFYVLEDPDASYQIPFQIIGEASSENITMPVAFLDSVEIDGNMVGSSIVPGEKGVNVAESSVTISAGEFTGYLTVTGTYDSLVFGEVDTILVQLNEGTVKADLYNNIFILKVQKYYPFVAEEYPGHYSGTYTGYALGGFGNWGVTATSTGLDIVLGVEPQTLVIVNGFYQEQLDDWGEAWTDGPNPVTLYMNTDDPANFKVEIVGPPYYLGTTDDAWVYWVGPHPDPGQFNAATKELVIRFYEFYDGPDALNDIGEYTVTLDAVPPVALPGHHDNK